MHDQPHAGCLPPPAPMTFEPLVTTATTARPEEAHAGARARVSVGEPEEWVRLREVEGDCAQNPGGNACYILIEQQRHGTRQARYERSVRRLETTQAVQAITQWQLAFHPAGERVCLHAFSVRRGGAESRIRRKRPGAAAFG